MAGLTIVASAKAVGVRPDTIRYYERDSLLPFPAQSSSGHRIYAGTDLERVLFVRQARQIGSSLAEIRFFLTVRVSDSARGADVRHMTDRKITDITSGITDLNHIKDALEKFAGAYPKDTSIADGSSLVNLASTIARPSSTSEATE